MSPEVQAQEQDFLFGLAEEAILDYDFEGALLRGLDGVLAEEDQEDGSRAGHCALKELQGDVPEPLPIPRIQLPKQEKPIERQLQFASRNIDDFLQGSPQKGKVLLVVATSQVMDYSAGVATKCHAKVKLFPSIDGSLQQDSWECFLGNFNVLVVPISVIGDVRAENAVLRLEAFGLLLLDYKLLQGADRHPFQGLLEKWAALPTMTRPRCLDLFTQSAQLLPPVEALSIGRRRVSILEEEGGLGRAVRDALDALGGSRRPSEAPSQESTENYHSFGPSETGSDHGMADYLALPHAVITHPYSHPSGAELSIFNCVTVFMTYCKAMLGSDFSTMQLFEFQRPLGQAVDTLYAVNYPTPDGIVRVTKPQVDEAWNGMGLHDVVDRRQIAGLREIDRQKIQFVYPIVLDMAKRGYIDEQNKPSTAALALKAGLVFQAPPPTTLTVPATVCPTAPLPAAPAVGPQRDAQWLQNKDPKSLLNELKHKLNLVLAYDTANVWPRTQASCFQASLHVKHGEQLYEFKGEMCQGKKAAEQSVALTAVQFIVSGGLSGGQPVGPAVAPALLPVTIQAPTPAPALVPVPVVTLIPTPPPPPPRISIAAPAPVPVFDRLPMPFLEPALPPLQNLPPPPPNFAGPAAIVPSHGTLQSQLDGKKPAKAQLNEMMHLVGQLSNGAPTSRYVCHQVDGGWQASVHLTSAAGTCSFTGAVGPTKRDSEELAAEAALQALTLPQL